MPTQGFQLSQFSRAPQVPGNIGVVDTKSIYGSVVDALKSFEAARTAQQVQAATDAELALATQKAATEQALLTPESEARRARANLLASESVAAMPGVDVAARAKRAADILSSATSESSLGLVPDRTATEKAKLEAERVLGRVLSDENLVRQQQQYKALGAVGAAKQRALDTLADPNSPIFARQAAAITLGFEPKAVAPGIGYQVLTDANGNQRLVATNKAAVGAMDVATGQVIGVAPGTRPSMAPAQTTLLPRQTPPSALLSTPVPTEGATAPAAAAPVPAAPAPAPAAAAPAPAAAAPAALAPTVATAPRAAVKMMTAEDWLVGPSTEKKLNEKEIAEAKGKALQKLPALQANLNTLQRNITASEQALDKAEKIIESWTPGVLASSWRDIEGKFSGTEVTDVRNLLNEVEAKVFTDTLAEMRNNSPTGAAVGNVSDTEGDRLIKSYGSLKLEQSPAQLLENIKRVKTQRRASLENIASTIGAYEAFLKGGQVTAEPTLEDRMAKYRNR